MTVTKMLAFGAVAIALLSMRSLADEIQPRVYRWDLEVRVLDVEDKPVSGVKIRILNGARTNPITTDSQGQTAFSIPDLFGRTLRVGDQIKVMIESPRGQKDEDEWVILSPWGGEFQLPPQANGSIISMRVARKKDFEVLVSATGPQVLLRGMIEILRPSLQAYAESNELEWKPIANFLDTLAESAGLYYEKGLASLASRRPRPEVLLPVEREQWSQMLRQRGEDLQVEKKYNDAAESFQTAVCLSPNDPELLVSLGQALSHSGRLNEAESNLQKALELRLKRPEEGLQVATAFERLARAYEESGDEEEIHALNNRALIELETAQRNNEELARFVSRYPALLHEKGRDDQAEIITGRLRAAGWGRLLTTTPPSEQGAKDNATKTELSGQTSSKDTPHESPRKPPV